MAAGNTGPGIGTYQPIASVESFTKWHLRDLYIREQLFNINDSVEDQEQEITGKVIRRSTNYVVLEDNNSNLHKCWIWNCIPQTNIDETKLHEINLNVHYGFEAVSEKGSERDGGEGEGEAKREKHFSKQKYNKSDNDKDYKAAP